MDWVFWNRRFIPALIISLMLVPVLSIASDGTPLALWFSAVIGVPVVVEVVWLWAFSYRLRVDELGVRVWAQLPWMHRWLWAEIEGFESSSYTAPIPLFRSTVLRIRSRRRYQRVIEVGYLDNEAGRARMTALVEELERIRRLHAG